MIRSWLAFSVSIFACSLALPAQKQFAELGKFRLPPDRTDTISLALGDVDGDGDLDLVCGNGGYPRGTQNRLYLNDGKGRFTGAVLRLPKDTDHTRAVLLGDVDGDADLDIICANGSS